MKKDKQNGRKRKQTPTAEDMPRMEAAPENEQPQGFSGNGAHHAPYPPGIGEVFGVDDMGKGHQPYSPAERFLTGHIENTSKLLPESRLDPEDVDLITQVEAQDQENWGYVGVTGILKLRILGYIGLRGDARREAVQVETGSPVSLMGRMRGFFGRMFGAGGTHQNMPDATQGQGY